MFKNKKNNRLKKQALYRGTRLLRMACSMEAVLTRMGHATSPCVQTPCKAKRIAYLVPARNAPLQANPNLKAES